MRGDDQQVGRLFTCLSPDERLRTATRCVASRRCLTPSTRASDSRLAILVHDGGLQPDTQVESDGGGRASRRDRSSRTALRALAAV